MTNLKDNKEPVGNEVGNNMIKVLIEKDLTGTATRKWARKVKEWSLEKKCLRRFPKGGHKK